MAQRRPDRRAPGEIRDAIVAALANRPEGATPREIHAVVEEELGGSVAKSSVRSYLQIGTRSTSRIFERVGHGRYKLVKKR